VIQPVSSLLPETEISPTDNLAVDLIDSMLVVNPDKRFTIDQCLSHPWMLADTPGVNDSTNGLVSGLAGLEVNRRGVVRERTLLSSINNVQVANRVPMGPNQPDLKIYAKNPKGAVAGASSPQPRKEMRPADNRDPREFMELGGKGDQQLFGDDTGSRYPTNDLAQAAPKSKGKGKGKAK
jgi:serine/threonine-protein kinase CHEK2